MQANTRAITAASITRELLALGEINHSGIEHSVVFHALSPAAQAQIRQAGTEAEKLEIACVAGDASQAVARIYNVVVTAPAARRAAGVFLPTFEHLGSTFLKGTITEEERAARRVQPK